MVSGLKFQVTSYGVFFFACPKAKPVTCNKKTNTSNSIFLYISGLLNPEL